jgi:isopenicillin N synthase-like dioxygenase
MTLQQFDFGGRLPDGMLAELRQATHGVGCFYARHPLFPASRCAAVLADAATFFDLPEEAKQALAIERSPHFRGYSVMRNSRDWREQIHFGREETARGVQPPSAQLRGPNLWPADTEWRRRMLAVMDDLETVAADILAALAMSLDLPEAQFLPSNRRSYLLLKLIHYLPPPGSAPRSGVAPHVDFSWITLLLQDDTGGLEIRLPNGTWLPVAPATGALLVNTGEILEFATGGYYCATPHQVVSRSQPRISVPFFMNPALDAEIEALSLPASLRRIRATDGEHVHRVFSKPRQDPFVFGEEEWRRKGLGVFCELCPAATPGSAYSLPRTDG